MAIDEDATKLPTDKLSAHPACKRQGSWEGQTVGVPGNFAHASENPTGISETRPAPAHGLERKRGRVPAPR